MQIVLASEVTLKIHHSTRFCTKYKNAFFSLYCDRHFEISSGVLTNKPCWNIFIWTLISVIKTFLSSNSLSHKREKLNSNLSKGGLNFISTISWRLIFSKVFTCTKIWTNTYVGFLKIFNVKQLMEVNHLHLSLPEYFWKTDPYCMAC